MVWCPRASSFRPAASVDRRLAIWSMNAPVPPGAGAVHPLLEAAGEVGDLRVLAAQLDGDVGVRKEALHGAGARDHLLDEGQLQPPGDRKAAGAGDRQA